MTYRTQSADTAPEAEAILFAAYRRMRPAEKLDRVGRLGQMVKSVVLAGLRARYPQAAPQELELRYAARLFDRATMLSVFGWDPDEAEERVPW